MSHKPSQGFLNAKNWYLNRKSVVDFLFFMCTKFYTMYYNELRNGGEKRNDAYGEPTDELY